MREPHGDDNVWSLGPSAIRFGGNTSERFNWKTNSWNAGNDWYFRNFSSGTPAMVDALIRENRKRDVDTLVTLPLLGWVAKDGTSGSYPRALYPDQKGFHQDFGNGIRKNGDLIRAVPTQANIPITDEMVAEWVRHLSGVFGDGKHHYIIGNEPMLWHETHRDVHPEPATYEEVLQKFVARARVVRTADPKAVIHGPALWGYLATQQSAYDKAGPWNGWKSGLDRARHGNVPFLEWFLKSVIAEEKRLGMSLIDVVDVHYYPENSDVRRGQPELPATRRARFESTRSLWDRSYVDDSWIDQRLYFIPRFRELIQSIKPSLKMSIGEYNWYAEGDPSGGVALAEVLVIFGNERLDYAMYWTIPPSKSPASFAFRLFSNYDGKGSRFGEIALQNTHGITSDASVFTSLRSSHRAVTAVVLNKNLDKPRSFRFSTSSVQCPKGGRVFKFDSKRKELVAQQLASQKGVIEFGLDPLSMAVLELNCPN
jgi:hypothetical protein